jgi:hypothetical protein
MVRGAGNPGNPPGSPALVDLGQLAAGPASRVPDSLLRNSWLSLAEIQAHGRPRRLPMIDSWFARSAQARELPALRTHQDYPDFAEYEGLQSYEDTRRGMARGTNHSTREDTKETKREQKAQVDRQKAAATTRSTGLRRRERRFESCRGHHA